MRTCQTRLWREGQRTIWEEMAIASSTLPVLENLSSLNRPTVVDLFAGCGGLSLGLEQAGFTPIFVNELNPDAMQIYRG